MLNWIKKRTRSSATAPAGSVFDQYERSLPCDQNAIDALAGWNSAFPPAFNITAGAHHLYADGRIQKALQHFGSLEGKTVLEIGPLEGMHTFMLNQARPRVIDAVEANKLCFLRCLVTKQILDIDRARFVLGDIQEWLEKGGQEYDLAIASGVLYHMHDPARFLQLLAPRAKSLFVWTHFFLDSAMPKGDVRRTPFSGSLKSKNIEGLSVRYYERSYFNANANASFCGGMKDQHYWMHREDILDLLGRLGYSSIVIQDEVHDHPGGPCFSLLASKP